MFFGNTTESAYCNGLGIRNNSVNPRQKPTRGFPVSKDNLIELLKPYEPVVYVLIVAHVYSWPVREANVV